MKQVTERALFERLKRKILKTDNEVLRKNRHEKWSDELGSYYTTDIKTNSVIKKGQFVDFIEWCKEYKVLAKDEKVIETEVV